MPCSLQQAAEAGFQRTRLERELLVRNFGDPISDEWRVARYHGVGELVASGDLKRAADAEFAIEINAGGERAGNVFLLALGGRWADGDIQDGVRDVVPEKSCPQTKAVGKQGLPDSGFHSRQSFRAQSGVALGDDVALSKTAIEFVQGGRAEGAIARSGERSSVPNVVKQRCARVEGVGSAVGVWGHGGHARADMNEPGVEIAPVIVAER